METTVMRNMTPMQTPSMVKKLLSFCTRMVWRASRMASKKGMEEPNGRGFRRTTSAMTPSRSRCGKPVVHLHEQDVVRPRVEERTRVAPELEVSDRCVVASPLLPSDVHGRSGAPLPAQHRVAAQ